MRLVIKAAIIFLIFSTSLWANDLIPERRLAVTKDQDFVGTDLQSIFDTNLETCQNACLADSRCQAFTFNSRSNSCFPKSEVTKTQPYEGAISARVYLTSPQILAAASQRADELPFLGKRDFDNAKSFALDLPASYDTAGQNASTLWREGLDRLGNSNYRGARFSFGAALMLVDSSELWTEYSRAALRYKSSENDQARKLKRWALSAAINAYLRSTTDDHKIEALLAMADALEKNGRNKDMLKSLRVAEGISSTKRVLEKLQYAIDKYGFRVTDHSIESDLAEPRICAQFSDPLAGKTVDYTPYVRMPQTGLSVEANGNFLCISGVEHGKRYDITLREGMPAKSGEKLLLPINLSLYVNDRKASAKFPGRAYVLPKSANVGIPIETVNITELDLKLRRVSDRNLLRAMQDDYFGRPLSTWQERTFVGQVAEELWSGTGEVQISLNKEVTTRLPMGDVIRDLPPGIYALQARVPGTNPYDEAGATQWFVLSDLGLASMSGSDGIHVFVRGLGDAEPRAGIKVTLLSRANTVLAETETDAQGYARFADALARGTGGSRPALLVAKDADKDIAFLSLTDPEFDLSDRGVEGRQPAKHIDMFLTTDRGAYRAGETINATALTRNATSDAIVGLPVTAILTRPDGVEYSRHVSNSETARAGGHVFNMPTGSTVPRGTWRLALFTDVDAPSLASTTFLVEDFLPERIDFDLSLPDTPIRISEGTILTADTRYLFGAPGADLPIEGSVLVRATAGLAAYPGYNFGRHNNRFNPRAAGLPGLRTDKAGVARIPVEFPKIKNVSQPLEALYTVRISEGSGRPVERSLTQRLASDGPMIGIKPMFEDVVANDSSADFQIIAIDKNETQTPMQVRWAVNKVKTRYQWYQQYGNWNWERIETQEQVASGTADLNGAPITVSASVDWGRHNITVERVDGSRVISSVQFYAGWYAPADASLTPDTLEVSLDKPAYATGETATLRLVPRYAGKALITVMSSHLIDMVTVDVVKGENLIPLNVTEKWGAGAYVTATVIRPMNEASGHNPARALGLSYAPVDPETRKLSAAFDLPAEAAPRAPFEVALKVDGIKAGETAYATIAAVDVGILNLTGFKAPDAPGHYFGQRRLGMGMRDVYGRLIDGMNGAMGAVRSGGDSSSEEGMQSPPPTEELVAYFSGPITVGADGIAKATFDLPEFNGTVRVMAVVWSASGVGMAEQDVLVRDPVVVTASLPRFMAPGDTSRLLLEITHAKGPSGKMGLEVWGQGIALGTTNLPSEITLGDLQKVTLSVPITASDTGVHKISVTLTTPDGKRLTKPLVIPVEANDPEVSHTRRFTLDAGDTFTLDDNVFAEFKPGSGSAIISVGALAQFDAPGLLNALDRYPYGCTEQTTSRAMPLLYLNDVASVMGMGNRKKIGERVDGAIERVLSNQSSNGAFGLWRPSSGDFWLDSYVTDFLSRARAKGYTVPDRAFRSAIDNLRNRINYAPDFEKGGEDIAYALFVLAREGAANVGDLRYYSDAKGGDFKTSLAAAQLGAALASYGDQPRADAMFTRAATIMHRSRKREEDQYWRSDYGTRLRDGAAVLALAVEAGSTVIDSADLAKWVSTSYANDKYHSTQESMWSLMAVNALINDPAMDGFTVNGEPANGPMVRVLENGATNAGLAIRNGTARDEAVTLTTIGVPEQPEPASGYGYAIKRSYYTLEGDQVDPSGHPVGTRLVTVLKISPFNNSEGRLMVNDPLPAGFEIDNPNLMTGGALKNLEWLKHTPNVRNTEFRSNRFLAAVDWRKDESFQLAYIVRAISPGTYHHPAASVEDMYRPRYRAHSDTGQITITE